MSQIGGDCGCAAKAFIGGARRKTRRAAKKGKRRSNALKLARTLRRK